MKVVFAALIAMLLVPVAAAGSESLSEENNTLWNQYTTEGGCCSTWASLVKDDPAFQGSGNFGTAGPEADGSFTWEWPLQPALDRTVLLDPDGTIESTVHVGGAASPAPALGIGDVEVSMQLLLGDEVVAEGSGVSILFNQEYLEVSWSVAPQITELDPTVGNLVWSVTAEGIYSGMYLSHTDANGNGWLTLPVAGVVSPQPDAVTIYQPLEGPAVEHEFTASTSDTFIHNFTGELEEGQLGITGNGTGNLTVTLTDDAGTVLVEGSFSGELAEALEFQEAAPGAWNLTLGFDNFNGTVAAAVTPLQTDDGAQDDASTGEGGDDTNATAAPAGNETVEDDEGMIPAPGIVPVGVLLLSAAAAVRAHRARRD